MSKTIQLTQGKFAIVDDDDYERVNKYKWCLQKSNDNFYAKRTGSVMLHRFIMNAKGGEIVDHVNMNGLDCRKQNLRFCGKDGNSQNRGLQKNNVTGFKGVCWHSYANKFRAYIKKEQKQIHLGLYENPIDAALAYDAKARELFGEFARTNF